MGDEVDFLPADKHKSFLQDGSITLSVISQTGPKYQKQSVYNIFAIFQGKHEGWSWFFACRQMLKVFSNWCYHFRCVWTDISKLPKITSFAIFLHVKKEVSAAIDFLQADKHESLLQIYTKIFWWVWSSIPKVFTTSLKKLGTKLTFLM